MLASPGTAAIGLSRADVVVVGASWMTDEPMLNEASSSFIGSV
jgi:hypothetical protein